MLNKDVIAQWISLCLPSCRPGSSPKHTIYAFIIYGICALGICDVKRTKINKKTHFLAIFEKNTSVARFTLRIIGEVSPQMTRGTAPTKQNPKLMSMM